MEQVLQAIDALYSTEHTQGKAASKWLEDLQNSVLRNICCFPVDRSKNCSSLGLLGLWYSF